MEDASLAFLKNLLETPSPSGFERPVQDVVRAWAKSYADEVRTDRHGNVLAVLHPAGNPRIMLAGHCDQIALMVEHIDDSGFLYVQPIGGWDIQILLGQNLTVWTANGPIAAVVARRATHLLTTEERNKVPLFTDLWLDIGVKDRKEAEQLVGLGDPVTFALGYRELRNGLAVSPGMDDKVGLWTVMETLRLLHPSALPSMSATPPTRPATIKSWSATLSLEQARCYFAVRTSIRASSSAFRRLPRRKRSPYKYAVCLAPRAPTPMPSN